MEPERLHYDLTKDSLVMDLGGYRGDFAAEIHNKFGCRILVFEPMTIYASGIMKRLNELGADATVYPYGLADSSLTMDIALAGDRTSAFAEAGNNGPMMPAVFRDIISFLDDQQIKAVDLIKINIEGGEYALLRRLLDAGRIGMFKHLQVQFHTFIKDFGEKYLALRKDLERTHHLAWRRPFVWESWSRR